MNPQERRERRKHDGRPPVRPPAEGNVLGVGSLNPGHACRKRQPHEKTGRTQHQKREDPSQLQIEIEKLSKKRHQPDGIHGAESGRGKTAL